MTHKYEVGSVSHLMKFSLILMFYFPPPWFLILLDNLNDSVIIWSSKIWKEHTHKTTSSKIFFSLFYVL